MSQSESQDLEKLKTECNEIRKSAFSAMRDALRYSPEMLKSSGYKSNEAALVGMFKYYQSKIDTLIKEHLRKYPDEA
jgi:hypothetical protein